MTDQTDPYAPPPAGGQPAQQPPWSPQQPPPYAGQQPAPYATPAWGEPPGGSTDYASWGRRVGGRLIDGICVIVPAAIIGGVAGSRLVYDLIAFIGTLAIGYMNGATGQSPGKRVAGLRLQRDTDGSLLGGGMGMLREIAHIVDGITLLIGYLWPLWDKKRQTFADKIVGSVVVRTN